MSGEAKFIGGIAVVTVVILVGAAFLLSRESISSVPEDQIVSRDGLHWHPQLSIYIKGKQQEIQKDIGIGAIHQPIHTHDSSGVIHMEMKGVIAKDDTKLGQFFKIWGKQFNANCIFDYCNGSDGKITMRVNGKDNTEFDNYFMNDKDKVEIRYE